MKTFEEQKSLNKFKQENQDKLKILKAGNSVSIHAYMEDGLKEIYVNPLDGFYEEGEKYLVLYGKGKSRKLRIMTLLKYGGARLNFGNSRTKGFIPSKYVFGKIQK